MQALTRKWKKVSIVKKLYFVVAVMAFLIAGELLALGAAMRVLTSVRAFVEAEGSWSKSQKNALLALQRYGVSGDELDFDRFKKALSVNDWDHLARLSLLQSVPRTQEAELYLANAHIHPDDIKPMISLLLNFHQVSYLSRAIEIWVEGDQMIDDLKLKGNQYRTAIQSHNRFESEKLIREIQGLDQKLSVIEDDFSASLGAGSRWVERVVLSLLLLAVLSVEGIGLTLAIFTARSLASGLKTLNEAAKKIGSGDFDVPVTVDSNDEIGMLAESLNQTRELLKTSYTDLESKVQARTRDLEKAIAAREEFLSIASHELKTPFTAMHLQLQLLERKLRASDPTPAQNIIELSTGAVERSRRLRALLNELFDLTRIKTGRLEVMKEDCDLKVLIAEVTLSMKIDAQQRGSSLTLEIDENFPKNVFCDSVRMSQIATNLISNAIKYGSGRPVRVKLFSEGSKAILTVSDQGEGIAESEIARIFERFERANDDPNITGLGLGLYITKHLVEAHGGTITASSEKGIGTIFEVKIPLVRESTG